MKNNFVVSNNLSFWGHVGELRKYLWWSLWVFVLGTIVVHYFHNSILHLIMKPLENNKLVFLTPLEPILFILKIDFVFGFIIASPFMGVIFLVYISPAIDQAFRAYLVQIYLSILFLLLTSLFYLYYVIMPFVFKFLFSIEIPNTVNMITANSYFDFILFQSVTIAVVFQIPLIIFFAVRFKIIEIEFLYRNRPKIYIASLIVLAIITPTTDIVDLLIVYLPMIVMYEAGVILTKIIIRRDRKS
jgi:sec-independent protein translocase protein TatC